jgi:hypothetical protein
MMKPYIGITGFTKPDEVKFALSLFPETENRKLMVGVLVTYKSLRGIPMKPKWEKKTPSPETISNLFFDDKRVVNLVHFSTEEGQESSVLTDILKVHELAGANFHGFQLNLVWPEARVLEQYRERMGYGYRIVLQIGRKAIEAAGRSPRHILDKLSCYVHLINDILFDTSGGRGEPFDVEYARQFLSAIKEQAWPIGLGVAGGLPDSLPLVESLIVEFPDLNIDAEGRLRDENNDMDMGRVKEYLIGSLRLFSG